LIISNSDRTGPIAARVIGDTRTGCDGLVGVAVDVSAILEILLARGARRRCGDYGCNQNNSKERSAQNTLPLVQPAGRIERNKTHPTRHMLPQFENVRTLRALAAKKSESSCLSQVGRPRIKQRAKKTFNQIRWMDLACRNFLSRAV